MEANLEKLSHLIKVCGFLLQTKVYLFLVFATLLMSLKEEEKA